MNSPQQKEKALSAASLRDRNLQMCLWFAELKTAQEVADLVKETYGVEYSRQSAWQFSKAIKWGKVIKFLRARILKDLSAIPIANKAIRLKYLQKIYCEALTESLKSINQWGEVYELRLGAAIEAIKAAREELEGKAAAIHIGEGGKVVFQDIKIEGQPFGTLLKDINNRLAHHLAK